MFYFFFNIILLQQCLLFLDKFFISHRLHFKLLVYDEPICSISQLGIKPRYHLFGLVRYHIHLPGRFRLLHTLIDSLLSSIEILVKHFVFNRVVPELQQLPLPLRRSDNWLTLLFDRFIDRIHSYFSVLFNDATKSQVMGLDVLFGQRRLNFVKLLFRCLILNTLEQLRGEGLQILHLVHSLVEVLSDVRKWVPSNRLFLWDIRGRWWLDLLDLLWIWLISESDLVVRLLIIFALDLSHFFFELHALCISGELLSLTKVLFVEEFILVWMSLTLRPFNLRLSWLYIQEKRRFLWFLWTFGWPHVILRKVIILRLHQLEILVDYRKKRLLKV